MKQRHSILILIVALIFLAACGIVDKRTEEGAKNQDNIQAFISNETEQG